MYVGIDIQKNVQSRNWYILHTYVRISTNIRSYILRTSVHEKMYVCRNRYYKGTKWGIGTRWGYSIILKI
jgi:hypothetical protein